MFARCRATQSTRRKARDPKPEVRPSTISVRPFSAPFCFFSLSPRSIHLKKRESASWPGKAPSTLAWGPFYFKDHSAKLRNRGAITDALRKQAQPACKYRYSRKREIRLFWLKLVQQILTAKQFQKGV